jgi:DNA-binding GntR family transcriptional regulator
MAEKQTEKEVIIEIATLAAAANIDPEKLPALREFMDEHDAIFESTNLLLTTVRNSLITKVAGSGEGSRALYMREVNALKDKLTEPDDSPILQLMVDRVVMCFLRSSLDEMRMTVAGSISLNQYECLDRGLVRAHNRFLRACDALAKMRAVEAMTRAAKAQASILEMKEKELRARIDETRPGLLSGNRRLKVALQKRA